ncbi:hypothetical protein scyTo_0000449 [Scyliorhinus torazame]|uniref:Dynein regulatory complex protein 1 C-terminal domain-containing protein n=1 Tax=Scyliorhinus torazame TaxID=75743 RepID=A0A401NXU0_SCYTO|nr:hypothetical protein [Scyliorhinus torazame]
MSEILLPRADEQQALSVNSDVPEQRIAARRQRIAQRLEEKQREAMERIYGVEEEVEEDLGKGCKQVVDSHQELKLSDDHYVKDLKKSAEDIDLLLERMEEQIKTLTRSYREEIIQIEKAFQLERHELMNSNLLIWERKMQMRRDKEIEYLMVRMEKVEQYESQLQQLRVQDAEEYNMIKIKLETDVEILEQQLEQMKAIYQLNQEKLEYNFQVLKKRDEENTITKSQQKRRITRQHDILNRLMGKLAKQEKMYREENRNLTEQYARTVELYKDLQEKMRRFSAIDAKKFEGIWLMNEKEAKDLVSKALDADRIIHEQQLGLNWTSPDLCFMKNIGPIVCNTKKKRSAAQLAEEVILGERRERDSVGGTETGQEPSLWNAIFQNICYSASEEKALELCGGKPGNISLSTVKTLLEVLCDESGFLIESKLLKIISPLKKDERYLIKLDAVFAALGIENEDDIIKLTEFFIKHCKMSKVEVDKETEDLLHRLDGEVQKEFEDSAAMREDGMEPVDEEEVCITETDEQEATVCTEMLAKQHVELVHPNDILKTLRLFLEDNQQSREKSQPKATTVKERDSSEDSAYWDTMAKIIPEHKLKTWSCLEDALEKYYKVLVKRANLNSDRYTLSQQNSEFRILLQQYMHSRVNNELEIPPTQLIQFNVDQK